jgi:hypothetical protein
VKGKQQASVFNIGIHKLPFYRAPVPDVSTLASRLTARKSCGQATIKLRVFTGDSYHMASEEESNESASEDEMDSAEVIFFH